MVLQRRSKRNESVGLLTATEVEQIRLSDDHNDDDNNDNDGKHSWDSLWSSRKSLLTSSSSWDFLNDTTTRTTVKPMNSSSNNNNQDRSYTLYSDDHDEKDRDDKPTKSCSLAPRFLTRSPSDKSTRTEPPSPLNTPPRQRSKKDDNDDDSSLLYSSAVMDTQVLLESPRSIVSDIRYSLRTSIGDGSLPQPPEGTKRSLRPNGVRLNVSHWSHVGMRPYMEDRYVVESMGAVQVELMSSSSVSVDSDMDDTSNHVVPIKTRVKMPISFFGIFDGHGGDKASQYCADWMSSYLKNQRTYPHDLGLAMKNTYTVMDQDFCLTGNADGTTACTVSIVGGKRIVCANAGDSRAIVVKQDGSVVRVCRDHKPGANSERTRIEELGGKVVFWQKQWRVEGLLAVSRGIGDAALKPYVTAEPEVCEYDVQPDDLFLILSSDGVWDTVSNEEAARIVLNESCPESTTALLQDEDNHDLVIDTDRFKWTAKKLCNYARSRGSGDNFSAICVDLQSCGNPNSSSGTYTVASAAR